MKVLITGATGFIGSHLCRKHAKKGDSVLALAMPGEDISIISDCVTDVCRGNILIPETLANMSSDIDVVYHLAARVMDYGPKKSFYGPIFDGTKNMLEATKHQARSFVYASSIAACGLGRHLKGQSESDPVTKSGVPYNNAKTDAEALVRSFDDCFENKTVIIRPSNVIGPGSVWVAEVARQFQKSVVAFFDKGAHSASLVYVENLVDAFMLAGTSKAACGQTYQIRDDWDVTWKRYLTDLGAMLGKKTIWQPALSCRLDSWVNCRNRMQSLWSASACNQACRSHHGPGQ